METLRRHSSMTKLESDFLRAVSEIPSKPIEQNQIEQTQFKQNLLSFSFTY